MQKGFLELFLAGRIKSLSADNHMVPESHTLATACNTGTDRVYSPLYGYAGQKICRTADVSRCCSAAASNSTDSVLYKAMDIRCKFLHGHVICRLVVRIDRKTRIGLNKYGNMCNRENFSDNRGNLLRPERTVDTKGIDTDSLQKSDRCIRCRTHQGSAVRLECHRRKNRKI